MTEEILIVPENKSYSLMLKDKQVLSFSLERVELVDDELLPFELKAKSAISYKDVIQWASNRVLPIQREHAKAILNYLDLPQHDRWQIALACKALSVIDCYWVKEADSTDTWCDVNFYSNRFLEEAGTVAFTGYNRVKISGRYNTPELTTQGAYAKCWRNENSSLYMYKANTLHGKESEAEFIVSKILSEANIPHVEYELLMYEGKTASKCMNLCNERTSIIPFAHYDTFANLTGKDSLKLVEEMYPEAFRQMLVIDYIIDNVDRHSFNWGFQVNADTSQVIGLHPLLDHNCALTFSNPRALSVTYTGVTLKQVARRAYRRLEDTSFVQKILDYLNRRGTKKVFYKLFGSDVQWVNVKGRCEELLGVETW